MRLRDRAQPPAWPPRQSGAGAPEDPRSETTTHTKLEASLVGAGGRAGSRLTRAPFPFPPSCGSLDVHQRARSPPGAGGPPAPHPAPTLPAGEATAEPGGDPADGTPCRPA